MFLAICRRICSNIFTKACNTLQRVIICEQGINHYFLTRGVNMKRVTFIISCAVIIAALCSSFNVISVVLANDNDSNVEVMARKTYKRRCTNIKCKAITEGTQPIFKCKICGSSTVPQK